MVIKIIIKCDSWHVSWFWVWNLTYHVLSLITSYEEIFNYIYNFCFILFFQNDDLVHQLTHWGRVTHICVSKLTSIGSDNGLSPGRRQAIIWTSAGILLIGPLGTNFSENLIEIHIFSFTKMHLKMSSGKWRPFCLGLNVLNCSWSCHVGFVSLFLGRN